MNFTLLDLAAVPAVTTPTGNEKLLAIGGGGLGTMTAQQAANLNGGATQGQINTINAALGELTEEVAGVSAALAAKADAAALAAKADAVAALVVLGRWPNLWSVPAVPDGQAALFAVANNSGGSDLYFKTGGPNGLPVFIKTSPITA